MNTDNEELAVTVTENVEVIEGGTTDPAPVFEEGEEHLWDVTPEELKELEEVALSLQKRREFLEKQRKLLEDVEKFKEEREFLAHCASMNRG